MRRLFFALALGLLAPGASAKDADEITGKQLDAEVKKLLGKGDASKRFDAMMKFLGVQNHCSANCKEIASAKVVTANIDGDSDDEKVLAIATLGDGACPAATLEVFILDLKGKAFVPLVHTSMNLAGGTKPTLEVVAAAVHSAKLKDLVLHVDGQCTGGTREHAIKVITFEHGKIEELANSADVPELASYSIVGPPPAAIHLKDAKTTHKLMFEPVGFMYDALPPYDTTIKNSVSKDTDEVLTTKQCAAPLSSSVAAACKVSGTAELQVAVKEGHPIGLTVVTTPEQPKVVNCLRKKVAAATWDSTPAVSGCTQTFTVK